MKLRTVDIEPTPDVFAAVMATGIVSIVARDHRYSGLSWVLGFLATLCFAVLVAVVIATAAASSRKLSWDLTDPDVTLRPFTFVAACAVLDRSQVCGRCRWFRWFSSGTPSRYG
jgi:tellurite resistance protein TehA-like permease